MESKPIGSGPYTLVSASDASVVYKAWDGYYAADEIGPAGLEFVIQADDNTRLAATRSGQLDATFIRPNQLAEAESADLKVTEDQRSYVYVLALNTKHPALAKPEVRQAISYAIDREAINSGLYDDGCQPSVQPYPEGYWAYNPEATVEKYGSHDLDRARELLAAAGYPNGFELSIGAGAVSTYTSLLEVIQAQLGEVGIKVNPVVQEGVQFAAGVRQGAYDASIGPVETGRPDVLLFWDDWYREGGSFNPSNFSLPALDKLYEEVADVADVEEQAPLVQEMVTTALDAGPRVVPICVPDLILVSNDRISNLTVPVNGNYSFRTITERR
jgi:peptide/nickel transport system substrate-binding protein